LTYFRLTNSGLHQLVRLGVCLLRPVFFLELAGTTIRSPDFGFNNRDVLLLGELPRFRNSENMETYDRPRQITQSLSEVDRAILDAETDGFGRVHYDKKTGKIIGGTIVARHAGEMIGDWTLAMVAEQSVGVLSSTIHSYPTQAEVLRKIGDAYMRTKLTPAVKRIR